MSQPYSRIPTFFPNISVGEAYNRKLAKSSLIRRIAEAQNYLWAHGRVYAAHGYEGNGNKIYNKYEANDAREMETMSDGRLALCVCAFLVPANWNKNNQVQVKMRANTTVNGVLRVYLLLENKNGSLIHETSGAVHDGTGQTKTLTIDVPSTGEYQIRVLMSYDYSGIGDDFYGGNSAELLHVSARWLEDPGVDTTWFEFNPGFTFSDDYALSSVILNKIIRNTIHLWARRTPEICQASLMQNYWNTAVFTEVARYVTKVSDTANGMKGQLCVYCTNAGAGNEIRLLVGGVVAQTWTALAAGFQKLNFNHYTVTTNTELTITIEAKSTAASANWGTILLGVQVWEDSSDISGPPATYKPLDFNGLEGDDVITATTVNAFAQNSGIDLLIQNDKWLAANRQKVLIGDWLHRTLKNAVEFSSGLLDTRLSWTFAGVLTSSALYGYKPRNITTMFATGDEGTDALATFAATMEGLADAVGGYTAVPFIYPYSITYTNHGGRLGLYDIFQVFNNTETSPRIYIACRVRRVPPYADSNDVNGTGPESADFAYKNKGYIEANLDGGVAVYAIRSPFGSDDLKPQWLPVTPIDHVAAPPYDLQLAGRLPPQYEGFYLDSTGTPGATRPEGMLYEMELCSAYISDLPLTDADLKVLF